MSETTINGWNFQTDHVQSDLDVYDGKDFISSESIVVCAITDEAYDSPSNWIPIGLLENAVLQQNKQVNQMFEIGSKKSFIIPGRTYKRLNLSRIMFNGDSLLKVVHKSHLNATETMNVGKFDWGDLDSDDLPANDQNASLYIDLASQFFNVPVDLGFVINDQENQGYGAFALTGCYIQSHQLALQGQQTVVMENISMIVDDIIPATWS